MMVGSYSSVKSRSSYIRYQEEQVIIRIYCEGGVKKFSDFSTKTYAVGTQKNSVLLSTQNIC